MATFTLTNNATTPTGLTLTVSGSAGGVDWFAYLFRLSEGGEFVSTGQILFGTGDFTTSAFTQSGLHLAVIEDGNGSVEGAKTVTVTNGLDAVLTRIRAAVKARILLIGLEGLAGGVLEQWTPDDNNVDYPCVILTHENTSQANSQRVVGTSDIGHPVRVMICDRVSKYDHGEMPQYDMWRQQIWRAFDNQRLFGVAESLHCVIEPDLITDAQGVKYELMVSQLVIRVTTREPATGA